MKTGIGIPEPQRRIIVKALNALLADEYLLYTKTRNYHWNVVGPQFNDLHKFFEAQYDLLDLSIDEIAERIRALGEKTPATLAEFVKAARLKEHPGRFPGAAEMLANLVADHEAVIRSLRVDVDQAAKQGDQGTADFLTGLMEQHEKSVWMIRSFGEK